MLIIRHSLQLSLVRSTSNPYLFFCPLCFRLTYHSSLCMFNWAKLGTGYDAAQRQRRKESGARLHFYLFFTQRRKWGGCMRIPRGGCGHGGVLVLIYPRGQYSGIPRLTLWAWELWLFWWTSSCCWVPKCSSCTLCHLWLQLDGREFFNTGCGILSWLCGASIAVCGIALAIASPFFF